MEISDIWGIFEIGGFSNNWQSLDLLFAGRLFWTRWEDLWNWCAGICMCVCMYVCIWVCVIDTQYIHEDQILEVRVWCLNDSP